MQAADVCLASAERTIQLSLECNVIVQVIAHAERRAVPQPNVVINNVVDARIHILITEERGDMA